MGLKERIDSGFKSCLTKILQLLDNHENKKKTVIKKHCGVLQGLLLGPLFFSTQYF